MQNILCDYAEVLSDSLEITGVLVICRIRTDYIIISPNNALTAQCKILTYNDDGISRFAPHDKKCERAFSVGKQRTEKQTVYCLC